MCGIAGYFVSKGVEWRPTRPFLADLIRGIAVRGYDASGYTTLSDEGTFYLLKGPVSAHRFSTDLEKKETLPIGRVGLLHTRAASVGDPDDNKNNHPLGYEVKKPKPSAVLITHNGSIGNLEKAYEKLGVKPPAEVDSALIAAALALRGPIDGLRFLQDEACGNGTIAAVWDDGRFLLARDLKPLYIGMPQPGVIIWSSEKDPLLKYCKQEAFPGIYLEKVFTVPDSWYMVWDEEGHYLNPVVNGYINTYFRLKSMTQGVAPTYIKGKGQYTTGSNGVTGTVTHTPAKNPTTVAGMVDGKEGSQFRSPPDPRLPSVYSHDYEGLAQQLEDDERGFTNAADAGSAKTAPFDGLLESDTEDADFAPPGGNTEPITEPGRKTNHDGAGLTPSELVTKYLRGGKRDDRESDDRSNEPPENFRKKPKGWRGCCGWMQCWKPASTEVKIMVAYKDFPHIEASVEERGFIWVGLCTKHFYKHMKESKSVVLPGDKEISRKTEAYKIA